MRNGREPVGEAWFEDGATLTRTPASLRKSYTGHWSVLPEAHWAAS